MCFSTGCFAYLYMTGHSQHVPLGKSGSSPIRLGTHNFTVFSNYSKDINTWQEKFPRS